MDFLACPGNYLGYGEVWRMDTMLFYCISILEDRSKVLHGALYLVAFHYVIAINDK